MSFSTISLLISSISLASATTSSSPCPPSSISVRLPPYIDPALNGSNTASTNTSRPTWLAPPPQFYWGTWYLTNCSSDHYRSLSNLQWDPLPVLPSCTANSTSSCPPGTLPGEMSDISTWALTNSTNKNVNASSSAALNFGALGGGDRPVASIFGYDTPRRLSNPALGPEWDAVYDVQVKGGPFKDGYTEPWSFLYWGVDKKENPFLIMHEGAGTGLNPPVLDVWSRSVYGADAESLAGVLDALVELGSEDLTEMVRGFGPTEWDYELEGGMPICGEGCRENTAE